MFSLYVIVFEVIILLKCVDVVLISICQERLGVMEVEFTKSPSSMNLLSFFILESIDVIIYQFKVLPALPHVIITNIRNKIYGGGW